MKRYGEKFQFSDENLDIKKEFFTKWHTFIDLEEEIVMMEKKQLFELSLEAKIEQGTCISGLRLAKIFKTEREGIRSYKAFFSNSNDLSINLAMYNGDPIIISTIKPEIFGLAIGFIESIEDFEIRVTLDNRIELNSSYFPESKNGNIYRIDKDELTSSFGLMRTNLIKLFTEQSSHIYDFVVTNRKFEICLHESPIEIPRYLEAEYGKLNENQKDAVSKVIENNVFSIIVGTPGSGKSFLLSFIIALLVFYKKRILLSSYTHSAVDNVLEKLSQEPYSSIVKNVIRLGDVERISKKIPREWIFSERQFNSISEIDLEYERAQIVGTTCLGINHPLFLQMKFDYVFVDEASQVSLPVCIGPLRFGSKFVLIGDHNQLPPLIKNKKVKDLGLDKSLFEFFLFKYPESVINLTIQYRMNGAIMGMANKLIYSGQLRAASKEIFNQKLTVETDDLTPVWIANALKKQVCFINVDSSASHEENIGKSFINRKEAELIKYYVLAVAKDSSLPTIGVISLYRPQSLLLSRELPNEIDVSTVDQYQGRDRDLIIVSLVRSNSDGRLGDLMTNIRRLNVAFTRAKRQLVIFGSRRLMESFCLSSGDLRWRDFWLHIIENDFILNAH